MKKLLQSRNTGLVVVLILLLILARILTPGMFTPMSMLNMLQNNSVYALLAVAEMVVILTSGIDISIASTLAFVGIVTTSLSCSNPGVPGIVCSVFRADIHRSCTCCSGYHLFPRV